MNRKMNGGKIAWGVLAGIAAGAVLGTLIARKSREKACHMQEDFLEDEDCCFENQDCPDTWAEQKNNSKAGTKATKKSEQSYGRESTPIEEPLEDQDQH